MIQSTLSLWLVLLPLMGALFCLVVHQTAAKTVALGTAGVGLVLAGILYCFYDPASSAATQFVYTVPWISSYRVQFALGIDWLSFPLICLTKLMVPIAIVASWSEMRRPRALMMSFLVLDSAMTGTFLATDIFLFYVFWELMLIPMILLIGVWGGNERIFASLKFFLYTFAGSLLMLVAIVYLFLAHQEQLGFYSSQIRSFYALSFAGQPVFWGLTAQSLVFLGFTIAFAIKVPLFPFHTWLPDAHVQAPTGGSILLAAVLLKMGTYGLLRFSIPICPEAFFRFTPGLVTLSLVGILYGAWVAFQQTDMKKLVAYSSVSHLGFIVLGICSANPEGLTGALLQNLNHGLSTGALFLLVGILYERRHSRDFSDMGGLAQYMPWYATCLVFVSASSMGVPGLNGFVGEFLILLGAFQAKPLWGAIGTLGVIFGAVYMLFLLRETLFGEARTTENRALKDLSARDWVAIVPLLIFITVLGVYPKPLLEKIAPAANTYWTKLIGKRAASQVGKVSQPESSEMGSEADRS